MSKQIFLTSSASGVAAHLAKHLDLTQKKKLVFIDTASEPERGGDMTWLVDDRQALVTAGFEVADYTITGKSETQLQEDLAEYDYIFVEGGDTLHLLNEARKSGFNKLIVDYVNNEGKIYIGSSAGSTATAPRPHDYLLEEKSITALEDYPGFGLVNFLVLPHWGSEIFRQKYLDGRLRTAFKDTQLPMITLTDNQYIHISDGNATIYDVNINY